MKPQFFKLAEKLAQKSNHPSQFHGAVLVRKNKVLGLGINTMKTHSKSPDPWKTCHAEFSAILNSHTEDFKDCELYVVRVRKNGTLGLSKPCYFCSNMLSSLGIEKVHYSTDSGFITERY